MPNTFTPGPWLASPRRRHVAILRPEFLRFIIDGEKTAEARFSLARRAPLDRLHAGDLVYLKPSGGNIVGSCRVSAFEQFESLNPAAVRQLRHALNDQIRAPRRWWENRIEARYGVIIWLSRFVPACETPPPRIPRQFGNAWLVLPPRPLSRSPGPLLRTGQR